MGLACRSYLFVPGHRPDRFERARASGADAVVIDLEDAVPPDAKELARKAAHDWLHAGHLAVVRINAPGTVWFPGDLEMCRLARAPVVMVPKSEHPEDLEQVAGRTPSLIMPLIESAAGLAAVRQLARVSAVQRLVFGTVDYQLDLGMDADEAALLPARHELLLASRLAGLLAPVDGVSLRWHDEAAVQADAMASRRLGFGARLCIHPRQIAPVHAAFAATVDELDWAREVVAACEASAGGAVQVRGAMVDRPVLLRAQHLLGMGQAPRHLSVRPARV